MNMVNPLNRTPVDILSARLLFIVAAFLALGASIDAEAKVTAFLAEGTTCEGAASAKMKAGGPVVKVSLCVTATTESLCGHTTKLQAADASTSGRFHVSAVTYAAAFSDPNGNLTFPIAVTYPAPPIDFGATVARAVAPKPGKQLLATFDLLPQPDATDAVYVISLAPASSVGVGGDGTCSLPSDAPIEASFKLTQPSGKDAATAKEPPRATKK
jgi:hypothetical protein